VTRNPPRGWCGDAGPRGQPRRGFFRDGPWASSTGKPRREGVAGGTRCRQPSWPTASYVLCLLPRTGNDSQRTSVDLARVTELVSHRGRQAKPDDHVIDHRPGLGRFAGLTETIHVGRYIRSCHGPLSSLPSTHTGKHPPADCGRGQGI
jgi:hypothetical protein